MGALTMAEPRKHSLEVGILGRSLNARCRTLLSEQRGLAAQRTPSIAGYLSLTVGRALPRIGDLKCIFSSVGRTMPSLVLPHRACPVLHMVAKSLTYIIV